MSERIWRLTRHHEDIMNRQQNKTRGSTHTATSYRAKYLSGTPNASHSRLMRLARMVRRERTPEL